jgi:hypothetical protein
MVLRHLSIPFGRKLLTYIEPKKKNPNGAEM